MFLREYRNIIRLIVLGTILLVPNTIFSDESFYTKEFAETLHLDIWMKKVARKISFLERNLAGAFRRIEEHEATIAQLKQVSSKDDNI